MEVRVYLSFDAFTKGKPIFCRRVAHTGSFNFQDCEAIMRCLFGIDVVTVYVCVDRKVI